MPKVSVIIPTYNYGRFLGKAIQSILNQTFAEFEIIVVNDGSTDDTKEVVDSFQDPRIRYIYQENRGLSGARNTGIRAAKGEYVAFLDSDDTLLKEALEKGVKVLDAHPEVAFSYGQPYHVDENGLIIKLEKTRSKCSVIREGEEEIRELIFSNHISASSVMARRSCLDEVGGFNTDFIAGAEDIELWVRLAKRWAVAYIAEPLGKNCFHPNSMRSRMTVDDIKRNKDIILESIFNDKVMGPLFSHLRTRAYSNHYFKLAGISRNGREMRKARKYLFLAMRTYPRGFLNITSLLHWVSQFIKTWLPVPVLALGHRVNLYLKRARGGHSNTTYEALAELKK